MHASESPDTAFHNRSKRVRRVANVLASIAIVIVLCLTLYPFDFTTNGFRARLESFLHPDVARIDGLQEDIFVNILLFIPLGYAFAIFIKRRTAGFLKPLVIVTCTGFLLSLAIEILQVFLPFRYSSLFDVGSNTLGSAIGFVIHRFVGGRISQSVALAHGNPKKTRFWLAVAYLSMFAAAVTLVAALQFTLRISEANKTWPLTVGNEPGGSRPWKGRIERLAIAAEPVQYADVQRVFDDGVIAVRDPNLLIGDFDFSGSAPFANRTGYKATLELKGARKPPINSGNFTTDGSYWLESKLAGFNISSFIMERCQFTFLTRVAALSAAQGEYARIVAIAADQTKQNFSVIQHHDDLVIRFRTMVTGINGTTPQFVIRGVFRDTLAHTILATFDTEHLRVYIDNARNAYSIALGPGFAFFHRLAPWMRNSELSVTESDRLEYAFRILLFLPFGILLGLALRYRTTRLDMAFIVIGALLPPLWVEWILGWLLYRDMNGAFIPLGVGVITATMAAFFAVRMARRRNTQPAYLNFESPEIVHHNLT